VLPVTGARRSGQYVVHVWRVAGNVTTVARSFDLHLLERMADFHVCLWTHVLQWSTGRYLTAVEQRVRNLEKLFAQLLPNVNVEEALSTNAVSGRDSQLVQDVSTTAPVRKGSEVRRQESMSEALPDEADGFEWKEETADLAELTDGMAALSVDPAGIGYLGMPTLPLLSHLIPAIRLNLRCCIPKVSVALDESCGSDFESMACHSLICRTRETLVSGTDHGFFDIPSADELRDGFILCQLSHLVPLSSRTDFQGSIC
jgi:hypothetical protein